MPSRRWRFLDKFQTITFYENLTIQHAAQRVFFLGGSKNKLRAFCVQLQTS